MPFAYFERLSPRQQQIYIKSDGIPTIPLPEPGLLRSVVETLRETLARDDRSGVQDASRRLSRGITESLGVEPVKVGVLAVRPTLRSAELHGLYDREEAGPRIRVWMRTAHHRRVVAFRTFLRTLLHEMGHHLDYVYLKLADSYHTEGFFKRESSLFYQLVPREEQQADGGELG